MQVLANVLCLPFWGFLLNPGLQLFILESFITSLSIGSVAAVGATAVQIVFLLWCFAIVVVCCVLLRFRPPSPGCSVSVLLLFLSLCHMHCFHSVCAHNCLFLFFMQFNNNNKIIGNKIHKIFLCVVNSKEQSSDQKHLE